MTTVLMFVTCLAANPAACEVRELAFVDVAPAACMRGAQPEMAKWVAEHPGHRVTRWSCRTLRPGEMDA
jgi:hypothetical protein